MVKKVTFVGFRGGDRPNPPSPGSAPARKVLWPERMTLTPWLIRFSASHQSKLRSWQKCTSVVRYGFM